MLGELVAGARVVAHELFDLGVEAPELFVALDEAGERNQDLGGAGERHRHIGRGLAGEGLDGFDAPDRHHLRAVLITTDRNRIEGSVFGRVN